MEIVAWIGVVVSLAWTGLSVSGAPIAPGGFQSLILSFILLTGERIRVELAKPPEQREKEAGEWKAPGMLDTIFGGRVDAVAAAVGLVIVVFLISVAMSQVFVR